MPKDNHIPKNNDLLSNARSLRKSMTKQEKHLWYDCLRDYPVKIYRQRIVGPYIADFYCHQAHLVIELDGSQHYDDEGLDYDAQRTAYMESLGLKVLRFLNQDVDRNFEGVCMAIDAEIRERTE